MVIFQSSFVFTHQFLSFFFFLSSRMCSLSFKVGYLVRLWFEVTCRHGGDTYVSGRRTSTGRCRETPSRAPDVTPVGRVANGYVHLYVRETACHGWHGLSRQHHPQTDSEFDDVFLNCSVRMFNFTVHYPWTFSRWTPLFFLGFEHFVSQKARETRTSV